MPRKTGYLANVLNVPPLVFRFQYNPDILVEKKSYKYEQAANFGRFALDRAESGAATSWLSAVGGFMDDMKEIGSILTATRPLESIEGEPRVFEIDFALDNQGTGDVEERDIEQDLQILRSFMHPGLDAIKAVQEIASGNVPCYNKPPECTLKYGGVSVTCVMTSLSIKMVRFGEDGAPKRAEVTVTLKEQSYAIGAAVDWVLRQYDVLANMGRDHYGEDLLYASPVGGIASLISPPGGG